MPHDLAGSAGIYRATGRPVGKRRISCCSRPLWRWPPAQGT